MCVSNGTSVSWFLNRNLVEKKGKQTSKELQSHNRTYAHPHLHTPIHPPPQFSAKDGVIFCENSPYNFVAWEKGVIWGGGYAVHDVYYPIKL